MCLFLSASSFLHSWHFFSRGENFHQLHKRARWCRSRNRNWWEWLIEPISYSSLERHDLVVSGRVNILSVAKMTNVEVWVKVVDRLENHKSWIIRRYDLTLKSCKSLKLNSKRDIRNKLAFITKCPFVTKCPLSLNGIFKKKSLYT